MGDATPWLNAAISGLGMALAPGAAKRGDERQVMQQRYLNDEQESTNRQMLEDAQRINLRYYGIGPQIERMKEAGMNPALMYGQSGAGGVTMASAAGGGGSQAPSGSGRETQEFTQMGIQAGMNLAQQQLLEAQKRNIDADTANKLSQNPNIGKEGVKLDTEIGNIAEQTKKITQDINNLKAEKTLTEALTRIHNIAGNVAEQSQDDTIQKIHSETRMAIYQAHIAMNEAGISDVTIEAKIKILKEEAVRKVLENAQIPEQTEKIKREQTNISQDTKNKISSNEQLIKKIAADIAQGWDRNRIDESNNMMMNALNSAGLDLKDKQQTIEAIRDIIGLGLLTTKPGGSHTPVGGFHKR